MPIVNSHGEGRVEFLKPEDEVLSHAAARFVDGNGKPAVYYPQNPNGSEGGLTAFTTDDGRFTIMMPHPERSHRAVQLSWHPAQWSEASGGCACSATPASGSADQVSACRPTS